VASQRLLTTVGQQPIAARRYERGPFVPGGSMFGLSSGDRRRSQNLFTGALGA
jgi:hypothetical protein